jgi:hypothetical protein
VWCGEGKKGVREKRSDLISTQDLYFIDYTFLFFSFLSLASALPFEGKKRKEPKGKKRKKKKQSILYYILC